MNEDLDKLQEIIRKLDALLKDRQPGLFSWCQFLLQNLQDLNKWMTNVGVK